VLNALVSSKQVNVYTDRLVPDDNSSSPFSFRAPTDLQRNTQTQTHTHTHTDTIIDTTCRPNHDVSVTDVLGDDESVVIFAIVNNQTLLTVAMCYAYTY